MLAITTAIGRATRVPVPALGEAGVQRLEICPTLASAAPAWRDLQAIVPCTPYQQFAWAEAWCATVGAARGFTPLVAVAFDRRDRPMALFPFVWRAFGGIRIAGFAGGKDANGHLAMFADPAAWTDEALGAVLKEIGATAGLDLFDLRNQPETWQGQANPFSRLPHQASPSGIAATTLRSSEALAKSARKRLRQKTAWLEALGPVECRAATSREDVDRVLAAHVAHRLARAGSAGIGPPSAAQLAFYHRAADPAQAEGASVTFHALWCGERIVATFGGTGFQGRFSGMILSADSQPDIARCSPGELLLRRIVADLPGRGFTRFDLGIGEARYKSSFCDEREPLFDCFVPVSPAGRVVSLGLASGTALKRRVKQSDATMARLRSLAGFARRLGAGGVSRP